MLSSLTSGHVVHQVDLGMSAVGVLAGVEPSSSPMMCSLVKFYYKCVRVYETPLLCVRALFSYVIKSCVVGVVSRPGVANLLKRVCNRKKSQSCGDSTPEIYLLL